MKREILSELISPNYNTYRPIVSGVLGILSYLLNFLFRGLHESMGILLALQVVDVCAGLMRAIMLKDVSSMEMKKGVARKVLVWMIIAASAQLAFIMEVANLKLAVIYFFIGSEILSIFENAALCGVPIPEWLRDRLREWHNRSS